MTEPLILLSVEDDEIDAEVLQRAVGSLGSDVDFRHATTGEQGFEMLQAAIREHGEPGRVIVLLDINLPRMNGHQFLARLRSSEDPDMRRAVVFVLTTSDDPKDRRAAYDHHVAGYIAKDNAGEGMRELILLVDAYRRIVSLPE